jgi:hypothetical protein
VAFGLSRAGDEPAAVRINAEAEAIAEHLPEHNQHSDPVFRSLAMTWAKRDPARAAAWLEKLSGASAFNDFGGRLAIALLPDHPAEAEAMWNRAAERMRRRFAGLYPCWRYAQIADFCYALARVDRSRAERIAQDAETPALRVRALGAIALAAAESEPAAGRALLESLVRDELPRLVPRQSHSADAPPVTAAWLLPIAEQIDPQLGPECLWRSLALRAPPRRGDVNDRAAEIELELAKMLARYDRSLARALAEPLAARLPASTHPAMTKLDSQQALVVASHVRSEARYLMAAAVHVDPHWAVELLGRLPQYDTAATRHLQNEAREALVVTLANHGADRWMECHAYFAGFWKTMRETDSKAHVGQ